MTYNSALDIAQMFNTEEKTIEFFEFYFQSVIRFKKKNSDKYLPLVFNEKREIFSMSFDFFVSCIAKFFDPGNKDTEEKILDDLQLISSIGVRKKEKLERLHKNRTFVIVSLLQDYLKLVYPNNSRLNTTKLRGFINIDRNYFVPIVYENRNEEAIGYSTIPTRKDRLIEFGIDKNLLDEVAELSIKDGLKDVAFNQREVNNYWENTKQKKKNFE